MVNLVRCFVARLFTHSEVVLNLGSAACPAAAQRCRPRLTEPLWQLAPRYRRPPPILGHCRGRAERRARRCGAGSGFYSASGTIAPTYGRPQRLLNNNITESITAVLPRPSITRDRFGKGKGQGAGRKKANDAKKDAIDDDGSARMSSRRARRRRRVAASSRE
jgi:hypothetical protein